MKKLLLAVALLSLAGCWDVNHDGQKNVAVLGDSNDDRCWFGNAFCSQKWVELWRPEHPAFTMTAYAQFGATLCSYEGSTNDYAHQMATMLASGVAYDVAVISGKTNDFFLGESSAEEVFDCLVETSGLLLDEGILPIPTTVPLIYADEPGVEDMNIEIAALNEMIVDYFDPYYIDFSTGFTAEYFGTDGIHLNQAGKELRVVRADP